MRSGSFLAGPGWQRRVSLPWRPTRDSFCSRTQEPSDIRRENRSVNPDKGGVCPEIGGSPQYGNRPHMLGRLVLPRLLPQHPLSVIRRDLRNRDPPRSCHLPDLREIVALFVSRNQDRLVASDTLNDLLLASGCADLIPFQLRPQQAETADLAILAKHYLKAFRSIEKLNSI